MAKSVDRSSLGRLTRIGDGGFGVVSGAPDVVLDGRGGWAYKEFTKDAAWQGEAARQCVELWEQLDAEEQNMLARCAAWPQALVTGETGSVVGFLMPLAGAEFFRQGRNEDYELASLPCAIGLLAQERSWLRDVKQMDLPDVSNEQRLFLLSWVVHAIGVLHKHDWVFGDISGRNILFALGPPRVMLVDCDGAAPESDTSRRQGRSLGYGDVPGLVAGGLQTSVTDIYKLGLLILRTMGPGKKGGTTRDLGRISHFEAELVDLVRRMTATDPGDRPTARDVVATLTNVIQSRIKPPDIRDAYLVGNVRPRGLDLEIIWDIRNASAITIRHSGGAEETVSPRVSPTGTFIRPVLSGPVEIQASSSFGSVTFLAGVLELYDLPSFDFSLQGVPRPSLPRVRRGVPQVIGPRPRPLPALPSLSADALQLPAIRLTGSEAAQRSASQITDAVLRSGEDVRSSVLRSAEGVRRRISDSLEQTIRDARGQS